jgi:hypothetical protein
MSHIFDDREKQFEAKYKHDEELRFKVHVRRDRLLGVWAAAQFGLKGAEAEAYAKSLVDADLEKLGHGDLVEKVLADFQARKIDMSAHRIRRQMEACLEEARRQLMKEAK